MTDEEVKDPQAVLQALRAAQEEIKRLSVLRDEQKKKIEELQDVAAKDEWRNRAMLAEVKSQLAGKGLKDPDRLIKVLGTDGLDFDEEGKLKGLDDRLTAATKDFPELFDPKTRAAGKADAHATGEAEVKRDPFREAVHSALN